MSPRCQQQQPLFAPQQQLCHLWQPPNAWRPWKLLQQDVLKQDGDEWADCDILGLIVTERSDHIKLCVIGHTSDADKPSDEPTLQELTLFLKSNELHTDRKRITSKDNTRQGITCIDKNATGQNASIDVIIDIMIALLHINLQPGFNFPDFANHGQQNDDDASQCFVNSLGEDL